MPSRRRLAMTGIVLMTVLAAILVCAVWPGRLPPTPTSRDESRPPGSVRDADQLKAMLDGLPVVRRPAPDGSYRRAAFGTAWADTDHNGCSQRRDALAAGVDRGQPFVEHPAGRCVHNVVSGTWIDPYTGRSLTFTDLTDAQQAEQLPIDHVVALAVAYRYGARNWSSAQRLAFATDLSNLQPTSRVANTAKSDHDPAAWRPRRAQQCGYAARYIRVKSKYTLPVDPSETQALQDMLRTCP